MGNSISRIQNPCGLGEKKGEKNSVVIDGNALPMMISPPKQIQFHLANVLIAGECG